MGREDGGRKDIWCMSLRPAPIYISRTWSRKSQSFSSFNHPSSLKVFVETGYLGNIYPHQKLNLFWYPYKKISFSSFFSKWLHFSLIWPDTLERFIFPHSIYLYRLCISWYKERSILKFLVTHKFWQYNLWVNYLYFFTLYWKKMMWIDSVERA